MATRKIKLLQSIGGHRQVRDPKSGKTKAGAPFTHPVGAEIEWDAVEAERFVDKGIASYVKEPVAAR